jgi:hypothetical protein
MVSNRFVLGRLSFLNTREIPPLSTGRTSLRCRGRRDKRTLLHNLHVLECGDHLEGVQNFCQRLGGRAARSNGKAPWFDNFDMISDADRRALTLTTGGGYVADCGCWDVRRFGDCFGEAFAVRGGMCALNIT